MYGFTEFKDYTLVDLVNTIGQKRILDFIFKEEVSFRKLYRSPFREDEKPGCRFEILSNGDIIFVDWKEKYLTGKTHRSVVGMVQELFSDYTDLEIKQLLVDNFEVSQIPVSELVLKNPEPSYYKIKTVIEWSKKPFNKYDKRYWNQYLISLEDLEEDNVFSVSKYSIFKHNRKPVHITPYRHCYVIDFIDSCKIYNPYSKGKGKFITNCDENVIGNFNRLPSSGDTIIIQKSYKDYRLLYNLLKTNIIWFQNEGCIPEEEILVNISQRFRNIIIFFDNDLAGKVASEKLSQKFEEIRKGSTKTVFLPENTYKDPSDFVLKEGRKDLLEALKQINLVNF